MNKKYLIPLAVGAGVLILLLIAGALFLNGNTELGAGSGALAAALAGVEARRQGRESAERKLDDLAERSARSRQRLEGLRGRHRDGDSDVDSTPLSDLVEEEKSRRG